MRQEIIEKLNETNRLLEQQNQMMKDHIEEMEEMKKDFEQESESILRSLSKQYSLDTSW